MISIRTMKKEDTDQVLDMMKVFYASPAVLEKAPEEVLRRDIEDCVSDLPFVEGYVFEEEDVIAGYSMAAKSYSTEFGGVCVWIEDLYIRPSFRGKGIGTNFFKYIEEMYRTRAVRFRLEVERENAAAVEMYKKNGFHELPYVQMTKEV